MSKCHRLENLGINAPSTESFSKNFSKLLTIFLVQTLLTTEFCGALFEDQAGKWDWRQQYIGKAKFIEQDASSLSGSSTSIRRIFVATHDNALAAINARTGHIQWRHLYEEDEGGAILDLLGGAKNFASGVVTISGSPSTLFRVRSWSKEKGLLLWESVIPASELTRAQPDAFVRALIVDGNDYSKNLVTIFTHGMHVLSLESGALIWTHDFDKTEAPLTASNLGPQASSVGDEQFHVVTLVPRAKVSVKTFDSITGDLEDVVDLTAEWAIDGVVRCGLDGKTLLCFDEESQLLRYLILGTQNHFSATPLDRRPTSRSPVTRITPLAPGKGIFEVKFDEERMITTVNEGGATGVMAGLQCPVTMAMHGDKLLIVRIEEKDTKYRLKFADAGSGEEKRELETELDLAGFRGDVERISGIVFSSKKEAAFSYRLVVSMSDHSLMLLQSPGRVAWAREEALASILNVVMMDLPVSKSESQLFDDENGGKKEDLLMAFVKRISMQVDQFVALMYFLQDKFRVRLPPPRSPQGHPQRPRTEDSQTNQHSHDLYSPNPPDVELIRDSFGLRKIVVVSTGAQKLVGIDSETGFVIWQRFLSDLAPFSIPVGKDAAPKSMSPLFVVRTAAHVPHAPQCVVLGKSTDGEGSTMYEFNPLTGEPAAGTDGVKRLGFKIKQASLLDLSYPSAASHIRGLLILDHDLRVHIHPSQLKPKIKNSVESYFLYTCDASKGKVEGFSIKQENNVDWKADRVWNIKFPSQLGVITRVMGRPRGEHTHSQGRVLADRSVMYKYLNPNLVAVVTEGEDPIIKCEGSSALQCFRGQVTLFLIDVVTGHIVFSTTHKKCKGPVNLVHSENWVVYSYWNQKSRRNEMASIELYEGKTQSNTTTFSSLDLPLVSPMVERQSFIFPGHIQAISVSLTEKGISNKDILISLASGGLLELPRMLLDPRRPVEPRPQDREEGLIPYTPELPIPTIGIVSYNQTISRVRAISSSPAGLESTSLVLVYGMDLFFTRIYPSKMFDVLKDDFDYFFISSVLFGLIAASFLFQQLAANKTIKRAWK